MEQVKAGDQVILVGGYGDESIEVVDKVTPSGLIKIRSKTFRPDGSERTSDPWRSSSITNATPEAIERIEQRKTIRKALVKMKDCKNLTFDQATKILAILGDE